MKKYFKMEYIPVLVLVIIATIVLYRLYNKATREQALAFYDIAKTYPNFPELSGEGLEGFIHGVRNSYSRSQMKEFLSGYSTLTDSEKESIASAVSMKLNLL